MQLLQVDDASDPDKNANNGVRYVDLPNGANDGSMPQRKALHEPSHTVTKNDLELQPNPAYDKNHVITDTNPVCDAYTYIYTTYVAILYLLCNAK